MAKTEVHILRFNKDVGTRVATIVRDAKTCSTHTIYQWRIGTYAFSLVVAFRGPSCFDFVLGSVTRSNLLSGTLNIRKKCVATAYGASLGLAGRFKATG